MYETYESTEENYDDQMDEMQPDQSVIKFKPSERLAKMESGLPPNKKAYVRDGQVKKTLENTFIGSIKSRAAAIGWERADHEWQQMLAGPEADRLIDTFGENYKKFVTSPNGAEMANALESTIHSVFTKAGAETRHVGLGDVISMTTSLFRSEKMPYIVSLTGGLIISAVNKKNALASIHQFWEEVNKLLTIKNLNKNLQTSFDNMITAMNESAKKRVTIT